MAQCVEKPEDKRNRAERRSDETVRPVDIFLLLRKRIAEALREDGIEVNEGVSSLQLAIGTFAPSEVLKRFQVSDFPFIGSRYVSVRDGHVYIVAGATDEGSEVMAYRMGFFRSMFTYRGGLAVGITEDGWMKSCMVMFSLNHASFERNMEGELTGIDDEVPTRRSYPLKKLKTYIESWKRKMGFGLQPGKRGQQVEV